MSITLEFKIDCARAPEFLSLMREVRLIHLRNGAYGWRLHEDLTRSNTFRLEFVVRSWNLERASPIARTDDESRKRCGWKGVESPQSATPPEERIYPAISNGLYTPRQCTFNGSIPSTSPPNFEIQEIQGVMWTCAFDGKAFFWHFAQLKTFKMRTSMEGSLTPVGGHTQKAEWRNESAKAKGFDGFFSGWARKQIRNNGRARQRQEPVPACARKTEAKA